MTLSFVRTKSKFKVANALIALIRVNFGVTFRPMRLILPTITDLSWRGYSDIEAKPLFWQINHIVSTCSSCIMWSIEKLLWKDGEWRPVTWTESLTTDLSRWMTNFFHLSRWLISWNFGNLNVFCPVRISLAQCKSKYPGRHLAIWCKKRFFSNSEVNCQRATI